MVDYAGRTERGDRMNGLVGWSDGMQVGASVPGETRR
jgi:hypothetical protein